MRHECMVLRDEHGASLNSLATTMSEVPSARRGHNSTVVLKG